MKKIVCLLILVSSLAGLITACSSEEIQYVFPLEREVIEKVLVQEELSWEIRDSRSFREGHVNYLLKNKNNKIICGINSYSKDDMRFLGLNFFTPSNIPVESLMVQINENEWDNMVKLACILYGNSKDYKKVYREFVKYSNNRRSSEYGGALWSKRIDDIHFRVSINALEKGTEDFTLKGIQIMNSEAYEEYSRSRVNMWRYRMDRSGIEILENITVSNIISMNEEDSDLVKGIVIKGHLENIRKLNDDELPSETISDSKDLPYKEDYLSAKLVDDTGSIQVFLLASSLSREELGQDRNHHAFYFSKGNICVIDLSVLGESEN